MQKALLWQTAQPDRDQDKISSPQTRQADENEFDLNQNVCFVEQMQSLKIEKEVTACRPKTALVVKPPP